MVSKVKVFMLGLLLVGYTLVNTGCAAGWFIAGAGATAAVMTAADRMEQEKANEVDDEDEYLK